VADPGIASPWALNILIDVQSQLTSLNVPFMTGATRAQVTIDNSLVGISQAASTAGVTKTDFVISIVPKAEVVPEPGTLALSGLALVRPRIGRSPEARLVVASRIAIRH
jgi:hypothetical protein